jgi:predicted outer membrane repeat protein
MAKLARWLLPATLIAGMLVAVTSAQAGATYTVNTTVDSPASGGECSGIAGDCSLRQALDKAANGDTVLVPASATPYLVTADQMTVPDGVTIQGAGASASTISGGGSSQLLEIDGAGPVVIKSLTLADAFASVSGTGAAITAFGAPDLTLDGVVIRDSHTDAGYGGAMEIGGRLTIRNSRFTHDTASGSGLGGAIDLLSGANATISNSVFENNSHADADGGAIYVEFGGMLTVTSSTFTGNSAGTASSGGAVSFGASTKGTFQNTTFSGNSAPSSGGAIYFAGTSLSLVNDTFSGNSAPAGANLDDASGTTSAQNTIFAAPSGGGKSCSAPITTSGHDMDDSSDNSCLLSSISGDLIGPSPALVPLADNSSQATTAGGPPQTMALSATSPAVGAADAAGCTTVGNADERGFPRPGIAGGGCDIGAFETLPQIGSSTTASTSNAHPAFHQAVTITAAIGSARALPAAVPGPTGTVTFKDGATMLGSAPVSSGHASLTSSTLPSGAHQITASYSGDSLYGASTATPLSLSVAPPAPPRPAIGRLRESHKLWGLGGKRAKVSRARNIPVGTVFAFKLNTQSKLRLTFRRVSGRHKGRVAGTLTFKNARAGQRKLSFQGRLTGHHRLKPGRYTLVLTASNATGRTSRSIKFRIVAG